MAKSRASRSSPMTARRALEREPELDPISIGASAPLADDSGEAESPPTRVRRAVPGRVLIAHPSDSYSRSLSHEFVTHGFEVVACCREAKLLRNVLASDPPCLLVTELRFSDGPALGLIQWARRHFPEMKIVVTTEHGSIATAVRCARLGVHAYYPHAVPLRQLLADDPCRPDAAREEERPMRLERAIWEYLNRVVDQAGSISRGAAVLGLDRRSLRRMLGKYAPPR